jgi:phosphate:Na+ symporter
MEISATQMLVNLLGSVALLLWGLRMVRTGVMRAFGAELRHSVGASLGNRFYALGVGLAVTVLLQSSTATALMAASFVGRGLVGAAPGLAAMLGADVGTSLVAQFLTLNIGWVSPVLILVGVTGFMVSRVTRYRDLGRAAIGLGLILLSLGLIVGLSQPMRQSWLLAEVLSALGGEPLLAVLLAALLTWLAHSSLAIVLLVASLAAAEVVALPLAFALVLGANLGGALPALVATAGSKPEARRVPLGNLIFRAIGVLAAIWAIDLAAPYVAALQADPTRQVVNFHTAFNLALATLFIFFIGPIAALCKRFLPDAEAPTDARAARYLDAESVDTPAIALACAARETMRMADTVEVMLRRTIDVLRVNDRKLATEIEQMDDIVDALYEAIKLYLTEVSRNALDGPESRRYLEIISFTTNLEHVGDIVDKNLMELAAKKIRNKLQFSEEGFREIEWLHAQIMEHLRIAMSVFISGEVKVARRLIEEKVRFRDAERQAAERHMDRMRAGRLETIETSALHLDVLRDLKRINSHLTAVAYPILETTGELRASRLGGNIVAGEVAGPTEGEATAQGPVAAAEDQPRRAAKIH